MDLVKIVQLAAPTELLERYRNAAEALHDALIPLAPESTQGTEGNTSAFWSSWKNAKMIWIRRGANFSANRKTWGGAGESGWPAQSRLDRFHFHPSNARHFGQGRTVGAEPAPLRGAALIRATSPSSASLPNMLSCARPVLYVERYSVSVWYLT